MVARCRVPVFAAAALALAACSAPSVADIPPITPTARPPTPTPDRSEAAVRRWNEEIAEPVTGLGAFIIDTNNILLSMETEPPSVWYQPLHEQRDRMQAVVRSMRRIQNVPPQLANTHEALSDAIDTCNSSIDVFIRGVEDDSTSDRQKAVRLTRECQEQLEDARDSLPDDT